MKRIILDDLTNEAATYQTTTVGYDGTTITPENESIYVAGMTPLYRKVSANNYVKRVTPGGYGYIEWFVGNDLSNGVANFKAIIALNKAGLKVRLPEGEIHLATSTNTEVFENPNDLVWEGAGINKTKIVLQTKHSTSGGSRLRAYFMGNSSVLLRDLELSTLDFENGIKDQIDKEYKFVTVNKPDNIIVDCERVRINGSITFQYQHNYQDSTSTEQEVLDLVVKKISARNCEFNYVSSVFNVSEGYVTECDFQFNKIHNLLGHIIGAGHGATGNKLVKWKNNYLDLDFIPDTTAWYHCPVVVRCDTIYYNDNTVNNLKNTDKTLREQTGTVYGAETYALYATANHLHFKGNIITNVLGQKTLHQDNCLFKIKGAKNVYCEANTMTLDKQSLVDIGVLESIESEYSTIDKDAFIYCFFGNGGQVTKDSVFVFRNNKVKIPYINYECFVTTNDYDISNNSIEIDYVAINRGGFEQMLFNYESDTTTTNPNEKSKFDGNNIVVNDVEDHDLPVFILANSTPFSVYGDTISRKFHSVSNNNFFGNNIHFILGLNQAKDLIFNNNRCINGTSSFSFERLVCTSSSLIPISNISQSSFLQKSSSVINLMHPKLWGISKITIYNNSLDEIRLMQTIISDWYENSLISSSNPILFEINVLYIDEKGIQQNLNFNFAQKTTTQCQYYNLSSDSLEVFDPRNNVDPQIIEFCDKNKKTSSVKLEIETFTDRRASLYLTGVAPFNEIEITTKVSSKTVNPSTFYEEWLPPVDNDIDSINQTLLDLEENKATKDFATTTVKGLIKSADIPADSTAEDLSTLLIDFNALLQKLRDQNTEL